VTDEVISRRFWLPEQGTIDMLQVNVHLVSMDSESPRSQHIPASFLHELPIQMELSFPGGYSVLAMLSSVTSSASLPSVSRISSPLAFEKANRSLHCQVQKLQAQLKMERRRRRKAESERDALLHVGTVPGMFISAPSTSKLRLLIQKQLAENEDSIFLPNNGLSELPSDIFRVGFCALNLSFELHSISLDLSTSFLSGSYLVVVIVVVVVVCVCVSAVNRMWWTSVCFR
jgi:hypothetical protein